MQARIDNPAFIVPDAMPALLGLGKAMLRSAEQCGIPKGTLALLCLRASQINGCSVCVEMHATEAREAGESDERIFAVGAWRETPRFTDAERSALALTEAVTRLSDRSDPVSDEVWDTAVAHYDNQAIATLTLTIATVNLWNRLNATTRQVVTVG